MWRWLRMTCALLARVIPERASSRVVELVFLISRYLNRQTHWTFACLYEGSLSHCACEGEGTTKEEIVKDKEKKRCYHWSVPFYLDQISSCILTTFSCLYYPHRGRFIYLFILGVLFGFFLEEWGTVQLLSPCWLQRALLCQYHYASPALLTLLNHILLRDTFYGEAQGLPEWI